MAQQHPQSPMDQLQAMLNLVLAQVGDVLSSPAKRMDPQRRFQLQRNVPRATNKFHEALDKFEDELVRAKAVMRRDYAHFLDAREQKERAVEAAKQQPALVEVQPEAEVKEEEEPSEEAKPATEPPPATSFTEEAKPTTKAVLEPPPVSTAPDLLMTSLATDLFTNTSPTTADMKDFDFDSMFEDITNTSPQNSGENTFDTTSRDQQANAFEAPQHLNAGQPDTAGAEGSMDDLADMSSLLRGIEGYANIEGNSGLPTTTAPEAQAAQDGATATANVDTKDNGDASDFDFSILDIPADGELQDDQAVLGENSFDDLFNLGDFDIDDTTMGNNAGGDAGDGVDEDWLKDFTS